MKKQTEIVNVSAKTLRELPEPLKIEMRMACGKARPILGRAFKRAIDNEMLTCMQKWPRITLSELVLKVIENLRLPVVILGEWDSQPRDEKSDDNEILFMGMSRLIRRHSRNLRAWDWQRLIWSRADAMFKSGVLRKPKNLQETGTWHLGNKFLRRSAQLAQAPRDGSCSVTP